ncbi:BCNT-domain-containing protein [Paraphaeosphaeria sporulosa]|uniref:SWR1-complex protein 5 n=1 Tax=Paraphaeosphaeria sporulosa TaxID=1460663 RepID=A0A177C979_9PLEO|nr:BCNT-domain-containing protein [Paraphaeosphaeria sporulosa]OAG03936.1 BCNT-domain-containing protein [Paraphaeosphaeria sporulosa]
MAPTDPVDDLSDAEANYHESSDDDFNPAAVPADEPSSSDDDDDAPAKPAKGRAKRKAVPDDELDSGDEVTIEAARRRKAKKRKGAKADEDELLLSDDGGDGGLIKTRAQRRVELKERKPLARTDGATVDVDALWTQMLAAPLRPIPPPTVQDADALSSDAGAVKPQAPQAAEEEEQVTVRKAYTFAGQRTEEEKQVPRSALEKFLSDGWKTADRAVEEGVSADKEAEPKEDGPKIRRPLRRPSRFDSNPTGYVRTLPPEHQLSWPRKAAIAASAKENIPPPDAPKAARPEKAQKLNVVDKSRLDWTGFVDKEGIAEELDTHGKTKEAYLGRMDFLAGVEARREEERKKMKTAATAS